MCFNLCKNVIPRKTLVFWELGKNSSKQPKKEKCFWFGTNFPILKHKKVLQEKSDFWWGCRLQPIAMLKLTYFLRSFQVLNNLKTWDKRFQTTAPHHKCTFLSFWENFMISVYYKLKIGSKLYWVSCKHLRWSILHLRSLTGF